MGRVKYIPAWQAVRNLARKHGYNPAWIWDVLDDYFNMRRGEGCRMTPDEVEALESTLQEIEGGGRESTYAHRPT